MTLSYTDKPWIGSADFLIKLSRLVMGEALTSTTRTNEVSKSHLISLPWFHLLFQCDVTFPSLIRNRGINVLWKRLFSWGCFTSAWFIQMALNKHLEQPSALSHLNIWHPSLIVEWTIVELDPKRIYLHSWVLCSVKLHIHRQNPQIVTVPRQVTCHYDDLQGIHRKKSFWLSFVPQGQCQG